MGKWLITIRSHALIRNWLKEEDTFMLEKKMIDFSLKTLELEMDVFDKLMK